MFKWTPPATSPEQAARDALSAAMWLHATFADEIWLWRGQADGRYGIEPSIHSRVLAANDYPSTDLTVQRATVELIRVARKARLDRQGDTRLPDLALLAHLQHYGAATPLLDVTTDPLIALWMIAFAKREVTRCPGREVGGSVRDQAAPEGALDQQS
jgi:hypothetical protein